MFEKMPINLENCINFFESMQHINDLEKLTTIVNLNILNVLSKNNIIKTNSPVLVMKFSIHFGVSKILKIKNLAQLQILVESLKDIFSNNGYKVSTYNQSNGTIIFSLYLPYNIEPTFV